MRIAALALLAVLVSGWLFWSSVPLPGGEASDKHSPVNARYSIEGLRLLRTDELGVPAMELLAERADWFDDASAQLTSVQARGLSGRASPWRLLAPTGTVPAGEKRLKLAAPVSGEGRWPQGGRFNLKAGSVWVDDRARRFDSSEPMLIDSPGRSARAQGFSARFDGSQMTLDDVEMRYAAGS